MTVVEYPDLLTAAQDINRGIHEKGFYEDDRTVGDVLMLGVSELSEALEEYRNGHATDEIYFKVIEDFDVYSVLGSAVAEMHKGDTVDLGTYNTIMQHHPELVKHLKPEGVPIELADCIIRCLDTLYQWGTSPTLAVLIKMRFNETRPYRHGKVRL